MIPRTGIEQPFLIDPPEHIRDTPELERTNEISSMLKMAIVEDYRMRESNRIVNLAKTVFEVEKESPHYKSSKEYLDTDEQIRITKPTLNGRPVDNPKNTVKNRYFKELKPWYVPYHMPETDDVLVFESRFESGNLKKAIQIDKFEYELVLKPDHNTKNYTQWFNFKIGNTRKHRQYIFHIINFVKPDS
mmetsp:Transcript_18489/g.28376  ORF Transcript_18489/g.28376 Transcript_18489/m.28376 type:complete len:189 (-) Transcript_18489:1427-1993(-)|eukprot:CAMPEP_0170512342 /NCGR_PEP_ID=MMETSP0208-20121228/66792_1 /TAXON_ID=197538 /ORGANISM="Strombidium inclinatum, Strain S3" /LENGTH=188 /DNA_ID=CAMNT_0010795961 /DNA_START=3144 /DNA_END=3710 /DNA_ORIENTATION=-